MTLTDQQIKLCDDNTTDISGLKAVFFNCTLKKHRTAPHTGILLSVAGEIMAKNGVCVDVIHPASKQIAYSVYPDITEHGWDRDDWPEVWETVKVADILVFGTPIWLGEESSVCRMIIERPYGMSGGLNDKGQSARFGKVGGAVITGNEDGVKHCAMSMLYALQPLGYMIPLQADCGWIGEAGPGPSYGDMQEGGAVGFDNEFTQRNTTIMTWNLMHPARMLKDAGGLANHGNNRTARKACCRFDYENPEHRV